jgi:hypothetical protein
MLRIQYTDESGTAQVYMGRGKGYAPLGTGKPALYDATWSVRGVRGSLQQRVKHKLQIVDHETGKPCDEFGHPPGQRKPPTNEYMYRDVCKADQDRADAIRLARLGRI